MSSSGKELREAERWGSGEESRGVDGGTLEEVGEFGGEIGGVTGACIVWAFV